MSRASKPCLYRYDSIKHKTYSAYIEDKNENLPPPSFIIPVETSSDTLSKFIVGIGKYVYLVNWNGKSESASINSRIDLGTEENFGRNERQGLGHRDPSGRYLYYSPIDSHLCGPPANQSVYVKQNGRESIRLIKKLKLVLGFAYVGKKVYVMDACRNRIIDVNSGRVVFDFKDIGNTVLLPFEFSFFQSSGGNSTAVVYNTVSEIFFLLLRTVYDRLRK